ncbi:DUF3263 domain-containing protein [Pseudofrankia sp. DC12]|uniref:DUF3263 domain-containing protein n=1 Tax=Pseudofrankia sp. DC12 TaxID=683315 RepID=UPI000A013C7F
MDDTQSRDPAVPRTAEPAEADGLSDRDARVLRFERRTWRYPAAKDEAIRAEFGLSPPRYYQLLNALIETPAALAAEPVLVGRLSRLRAARRQGWSPAASVSARGGRARPGLAPDADRATSTITAVAVTTPTPPAADGQAADAVEPYPTDPADPA